jgi:hypothetical protein
MLYVGRKDPSYTQDGTQGGCEIDASLGTCRLWFLSPHKQGSGHGG